MDPVMSRRCRHCQADVPTSELACPDCGRYFDGGFDFPDLIDGMRAGASTDPQTMDAAGPAALRDANTMLPGFLQSVSSAPTREGRWHEDPVPRRSSSQPTRTPMTDIGQRHEVSLPEVGAVTDLPYAEGDDVIDLPDEVIDLRHGPASSRAERSWFGRRRSRT